MASAAVVKETLKEAVVGSDEPAQLSAQSKARFTSNAVKDPETGELYMGSDEFISAITPSTEDFVSWAPPQEQPRSFSGSTRRRRSPSQNHSCGQN